MGMSVTRMMIRGLSTALVLQAVLTVGPAAGTVAGSITVAGSVTADGSVTAEFVPPPADTVRQRSSGRARRPIPYPVVPSRGFIAAVEKGTRTTSGRPGPAYWQQWTDYELTATLRPEERRLYGRGRITYHNRSPDSLPTLYLHLMQNVHAVGAMRNRPQLVTGGIVLSRVVADGAELTLQSNQRPPEDEDEMPSGYAVRGTILRMILPETLRPGESVELELDWTFQIPSRGGGNRMGWNGDDLFFIAYWYPQMAVYDDVVGWQIDPFLGAAELYTGFGSYELTVEVPAGWLVLASGALLNPDETLGASVLTRLRQAEGSDSVVHVVRERDLEANQVTRPNVGGPLSWRFHADTARDVAFSASRASLWDAARTPVGDRDADGETDYARVDAIYRPSAPRWANAARYGQHAIDFLSRYLALPSPWNHMSLIEGGGIMGGGMEFPLMTLIGSYNTRSDSALYYVTAHELGHMWLPMIVGTDERRHAWMDEGMTSFNENEARKEFFPGEDSEDSDREGYLEVARSGGEGEMMRWTDYQYPGRARTASYSKPSTVQAALRGLLGEDVFLRAYREYIRRWAFKHPTPWDFFYTIEDVTGRDLEWFWRAWYYETWTLDQAVTDVRETDEGTEIVIRDLGLVPMPARVRVTRENGEVLDLEVPVDTWLAGEVEAVLTMPAGSPVVRVEIDPERLFPDIDRQNNVWDSTGSAEDMNGAGSER
ncbi:MAG: M1 family metallopeptidase [Gemmatimonadales bacterium]